MTNPTTAPPPPTAIARVDRELDRLRTIGGWLAAAESGSADPKALGAAAALRLYYAESMGLPPLAALELSVIKGKVVPSAQLLRALAAEAGLRIVRVASSETACTAAVQDKLTGVELGRTTFTIEQAKRAGLVKAGGNWTTYPERMLWARASTWAIRDYAPKVALGMTFGDEVEEVTGQSYDVEAEAEPVDDTIEWPGDGPSVPLPETEAAETTGGQPATDAQRERIASLFAELTELEHQAGIDATDWNAWLTTTAGTESGRELTRERARHAIEQAESIGRKLRELIVP